MSKDRYWQLLNEFCDLTGSGTAEDILRGAGIEASGVQCSVDYRDHPTHPQLLLYCDFGALPEKEALPAAQRLLEANLYLFSTQEPGFSAQGVFTISPDTGHVLLSEAYPLENMSAVYLHEVLQGVAELAKNWRKDYFLTHPDISTDLTHIAADSYI